jgi:thioredoxin-like negative regulator of GroEL
MSCLDVSNDANLKKFNNDHKKGVWFVWFHAEWCGHCRDMHNDWEELSHNNKHNVQLAKVEHDFVSGVENNPPVQGYPTIVLYKNGKVVGIYQGQRNQESFNNYLGNNVETEEVKPNPNLGMNSNSNSNNNSNNSVVRLQKPKKVKRKNSRKAKAKGSSNNNSTGRVNSKKNSKSNNKPKRKASRKKTKRASRKTKATQN